ncbi:MAG: hypothetical protein ACO1N9_14195 [Flavobacterium sp.]
MNEKKNIDRLFQEKFRDFEVAPPEMAWSNIEAELLKKKQKRRVIPLWYRVGGVAAILVVGLLISMPLINNGDENSGNGGEGIVIEENGTNTDGSNRIYPTTDPIQPNEIVADSSGAFENDSQTAVVAGDNVSSQNNKQTGVSGAAAQQKTSGIVSGGKNAVASENNNSGKRSNQNQSGSKFTDRQRINNSIQAEEGVAHRGNRNNTGKSATTGNVRHNNTNAVTQREGSHNSAVAQRSSNGTVQDRSAMPDGVTNSNRVVTAVKTNEAVAVNPAASNNSSAKNGSVDYDGKALIEAAKANEALANAPFANDSTRASQENELEKLLKEKELGKEKEQEKALAENNTKWNIKPQMAPVFYNSMGDGSPIDANLANNSKSYDNDLSYGLGVNYAVNDRISIRSGINTVNLSYSTNGIQFYAALNQQTPNVAARGTRANIVVQDQGSGPGSGGGNGFAAEGLDGQKFNGSMIQKMGYIEVPLEMSYKLLNKRFGIDVIGGVSTLFLNHNNVSVVSNQGLSSDMGEAQNLNNVHFSTNIGVGFRYRFWKAFEANFEPMFKYQVNTFSSDSGNFKPYFIGLYSGISFSF